MTDTGFHGVTVRFEKHWAHVVTDQNLTDFLKTRADASLALSAYILARYRALGLGELEISQTSLAVEILVHAYLDLFSQKAASVRKVLPEPAARPFLWLMERLHGKTAVIDCGERRVDHNRFVFDDLAPFHTLLFAALGIHP